MDISKEENKCTTSDLPTPSLVEKNKKGKFVETDRKIIIINLYQKYLRKHPNMKKIDLMNTLSTDTGIGVRTIKNTVKDYNQKKVVCLPNKKKIRPTIFEKTDDFDKKAIRKTIHDFWFRREIPTLIKVSIAISEDSSLPDLSRSSLYRLLANLNFESSKRNRNGALTETDDLILWRSKFIEDIRRYRNEGRTIYYLGETCVNVNECSYLGRVDNTEKLHRRGFAKRPTMMSKNSVGKGNRLIMLHIGSSNGFVEGGIMCFESKIKTDFHYEINSDLFYDWFCGVLPLLDKNSVVVMDNASYRSVKKDPVPTMSWTKDKIVQWLQEKNVIIDKPMIKVMLMQKVKEIQSTDIYVIDEKANENDKIVLRLPPHHSELNAIELAWSFVKNHVKHNNTTRKLNDVRQLLIDGIRQATPEMWDNFVKDTIKEEDKMWDVDFIIDEMLDEADSRFHVLKSSDSD